MARPESAAGTLPLAAAASSTIHDMSWIVNETRRLQSDDGEGVLEVDTEANERNTVSGIGAGARRPVVPYIHTCLSWALRDSASLHTREQNKVIAGLAVCGELHVRSTKHFGCMRGIRTSPPPSSLIASPPAADKRARNIFWYHNCISSFCQL